MCPFLVFDCLRVQSVCISESPMVCVTLSLSFYFLFNLIQILVYAQKIALPGEPGLARLIQARVCLWGMAAFVAMVTSGMQHTVKVSSCMYEKA